MKELEIYRAHCPHCRALWPIACHGPYRDGRGYRVYHQPHEARRRQAEEDARLRRLIERRQVAYLWGRKYLVTPRLVSEIFGDGKKMIWLSGINTRPAYWVVRVDSSWNLDNWDEPPTLCDHLEGIYQAIENEFGTGEKEDGSLYADARFPRACHIGDGCSWGDYELSA